MTVSIVFAVIAGVLAGLIGTAALWRGRNQRATFSFFVGMWLLAGESFLSAACFQALLPENILFWHQWKLAVASFLPGVWLFFSLAYSRGNFRESLTKWAPVLGMSGLIPLIGLVFRDQIIKDMAEGNDAYSYYLRLGPAGLAYAILMVLGSVLIVMNFERTFRASVGTMRWRIKFMLLGLGTVFVVRFYTSSQSLLFSGIKLPMLTVEVIGLVLGILLMSRSLWRSGPFSQDVYPSQSVLHYSLTGLFAGIYLLVVGGLAKIVSLLGGSQAFPVQAFLVLVALTGLAVVLFSERLRQRMRLFVSRHFSRPYYNYRQIWTTFTEHTSATADRAQFCRAVVRCISEIFQVLSVTLWIKDQNHEKLVLGASTAIEDSTGAHETALHLQPGDLSPITKTKPVNLETAKEPWARQLKEQNPKFFDHGGSRYCLPIVNDQTLLGLLMVGDRVNTQAFSVEDLDLLACLGEQIAANLLNIQLSHHLLEMKEMEAFQAMSAFFVHDLKNTASTLSLMLKNMSQHFDDPEFRQDALRGLGKSVERINDLIQRLGLLRQELTPQCVPCQAQEIARAALETLGPTPHIRIETEWGNTPPMLADAGQMQKVLSNFLMNSVDAISGEGEIRLETSFTGTHVIFLIRDNGCGMDPAFMQRSLFRPFQTTKKKGIGIGMFLSKRIVEAHGGNIEVESQPGQGTTFQIFVPPNAPEPIRKTK